MTDPADIRRLLTAAQMSLAEANAKAVLAGRAAAAVGGNPTTEWFVPGRVEFLGKHTDYAGGRSLLCAVEQGFCFAARQIEEPEIRFHALSRGERITFPLAGLPSPEPGAWSNYPMTVVARLMQNFPGGLRGAEVAFDSDLTPAAGMSSSSALIVGTFLVLSDLNRLNYRSEYTESIRSPDDVCAYLGCIENGRTFRGLAGSRGVGTFGGSQDHTAILRSRAGELVQYSFSPLRCEASVPVPAGHEFVIAASGIAAEKTGGAQENYNSVSRKVRSILSVWKQTGNAPAGTLAELVRSAPDAVQRLRVALATSSDPDFPADELIDRLDVFLLESEQIIPDAAAALVLNQLDEMGRLVDLSQHSAEKLLGNQIPETIFLAAAARQSGASAASAFGAGFGGSVWALVPTADVDQFKQKWSALYRQAFPQHASQARFFTSLPGPPATRLSPVHGLP